MANESEPRALSAALSAPALVTRGHGAAMHAANRHVERWAPEASAVRMRSMRSLGFVDRLVAPWMETAQRSASLRLLSQYAQSGAGEREGGAVSWVFPRPWYQDELDWMAAARQVHAQTSSSASPSSQPAPRLLTTRATYMAPSAPRPAIAAPAVAMPSALYEHIAPSLSIAANQPAAIAGVGFGGETLSRSEAYSPLISLASVQAADLMSRTVAPLAARGAQSSATAMTPGLRSLLTSILERAAVPRTYDQRSTRLAMSAPELVTPPSPRPGDRPQPELGESASATQVAEQYAAQRARVVELQRIAQQSSQRELLARPAPASAPTSAEIAARAGAATAPAEVQAAASAAEARATAERADRELRQRVGAARADEIQRQAATAAERARIEAQIAQRVAERTTAAARLEDQRATAATSQRLHEQARADAAVHARTAIEPARGPDAAGPALAPRDEYRPSAEVTAAVAGLPPELAAILGSAFAQRPGATLQAISDLNNTLRTVELLARSSAAGVAFEATRGPRLMMPAGLGGLVHAVDHAQAIADRPAMLGGRRPLAALPQLVEASQASATAPGRSRGPGAMREARMPSLSWLRATPTPQAPTPSNALGATATAAPAALSHMAWADRWLARFAGAGPQSLDLISAAAAADPAVRLQALANAAPGAVFVAPDYLRGDLAADAAAQAPAIGLAAMSGSGSPAPHIPGPRLINPPQLEPIRRFDDDAETPDDVFAAISAAASRGRGAASRPAPAASASVPSAATGGPASRVDRPTYADLVAHSAPNAPGAGLSAQLASSPFAPALRHVLALPSAGSFDVRSLFGAGLGATYLAGLLGMASRELEIGAQRTPTWAAWTTASGPVAADHLDRLVPAFDPAYVSPEAPGDAGETAGLPLTTLRSALLSWDVVAAGADGAGQAGVARLAPGSFATAPSASFDAAARRDAAPAMAPAHAMIDAMSLPMLGETADERSGWTAPGMIADRAQTWSVAQERSSADLALDFVTPELVLAARVYGLGPADAAQAVRLAIAGSGQLGAMASTIDRTFVEALAIARQTHSDGERRAAVGRTAPSGEPRTAITTAFPTADGEVAAHVAPASRAVAQLPSGGAAFGVDRRTPRGAFLWPSAAVAALGMNAAGSDGQQSMSVAALELLAARVVAEIGTYTALSEAEAAARGRAGEAGSERSASGVLGRDADQAATPALVGAPGGSSAPAGAEPREADVLDAVAVLVPASRRARFEALYVALSQSPAGVQWSPAARAARALALAGRGDDARFTARERAATAWDVLPVVYANDGDRAAAANPAAGGSTRAMDLMASYVAPGGAAGPGAPRTAGGPSSAADYPDQVHVVGPGLGRLSARAGEALGSYVTPVAAPAAPRERPSDLTSVGAMMRPPTAAPEYVQTGRSGGRHGGGEVEIPPWFEAAARKMLADRGSEGGISLAELTLVTAAPASHVAASTRAAPSASPPAPGSAKGASQPAASQIDVDKLANDIYRQILILMDAARARNGEPYL